jgi:hypothetical protein
MRAIVAGLLFPLVACLDPCGNNVLLEVPSPTERQRAVVFERSCGATTGFSTHVSVLDVGQELPQSGGNVFDADSNHGAVKDMKVTVRWVSQDKLVIRYPTEARVFRKMSRIRDVAIAYENAPYGD